MKKYQKYFGLIFAILISILIFVYRESLVSFQGYGIFGLFLLSVVGNATIVLPTPVVLTAFVGGSIYNPLLVTLAVSFGATIGEMTGYLAGISGRESVENSNKLEKIKKWMEQYGVWTLFVLAAIPNPLFDLAGIVAGATKIPVYKYFIAVFFGKIIKFGVLAYIGDFMLN